MFNSLLAIRHNPELIKLLTDYLEIVKKDSRGELSPEQKVIYDRLNEYIKLNHELKCKKPSQKRREIITQRINEINIACNS